MVATLALARSSFSLFVIAAMLFGINMAFTQQYRYAAAESAPAHLVPRAVSFVLLGSIGGAFAGRELVTSGFAWLEQVPYGGTMLMLAALYVVQALLFLMLQGVRSAAEQPEFQSSRTVRQIVLQPVYVVAVLGGTIGYGLMALVMTATPLSMHINDGYPLEATADVIRAHVLGMYVPSLVSGLLIERFGVSVVMFAGAALLLGTSVIGLQGQSIMHYTWALILLGVGWNFLFVGATTMLTYTYSIEERYRAQAFNELLVFGTAAAASLLAGTVMHYFGWNRLMLVPIPVLVLVCVALIWVRGHPQLRQAPAADTPNPEGVP